MGFGITLLLGTLFADQVLNARDLAGGGFILACGYSLGAMMVAVSALIRLDHRIRGYGDGDGENEDDGYYL
jgi:hypothetical protein